MKILFLHPCYQENKKLILSPFKKLIRRVPLTFAQLIALTPENHEIEIIDEGQNDRININKNYDLVAISTITKNAYRAYKIADKFREKNIPVVMGGYHPSTLPNEAMDHADSVVVGEAELTWPQLLKDFKDNNLKPFYFQHKPIDPKLIPKADRKSRNGYQPSYDVQATRGCPYQCEFCAIQNIEGHYFRKRPIEDVIDEIKLIKGSYFGFYDASLTIDTDYTKTLFKRIGELKKTFICQGNINTLKEDEELLKISSKAGCVGWYIGFESITQGSLDSVGKVNKVKNYDEAIKKIRRNKMAVKGLFMFGFDKDTPDCFDKTLKAIKEWKIDGGDFTILTPFPGTKIYKKFEKEGRIISKDWSKYTCYHVVFEPKNMTKEELLEKTYSVINRYYSYKTTLNRMLDRGNLTFSGYIQKVGFNRFDREFWYNLNIQ